ncbi:putative reverse transcriptase domain-containing protein [Tanacetum coccineum]
MRQCHWIELFSDYDSEIRYHPGKDRILAAQKEAVDKSAGLQKGLDEMIEQKTHKSKYFVHPGADKMNYDLRDRYWWPGMKKDIAVYAKVGEGPLIGPELVQETIEKISQIKDKLKAAHDCQKSYADKRREPLEFSVGDYVLLKVSPWKGVVRFRKKGKLAPRIVRPFEIIEKIGPVAYMLDFPEKLDGVHDTFHVSNLKKCLADPTLEFKKLKRSRIVIVKVQWNSKCGPEFTWEHGDQMKLKYPHLFSDDSS